MYYDIYVFYVYYVFDRVPPPPPPSQSIESKGRCRSLPAKYSIQRGLEVKIFIRKDLAEQFGQTRRELGLKDCKCTLAPLPLTTDYWLLTTDY